MPKRWMEAQLGRWGLFEEKKRAGRGGGVDGRNGGQEWSVSMYGFGCGSREERVGIYHHIGKTSRPCS